jgi:hypothetical protein
MRLVKTSWLPWLGMFWASQLLAQDGSAIMVTPTTLVLGMANKSGVFMVAGGNAGETSIQVDTAFYRQDAKGQLAPGPASPQSAAEFLRVGPRKFTLSAGRGGEVRVAARPPATLAPGEYRTHLVVRNVGSSTSVAHENSGSNSEQFNVVIPIRIARGVRVLYRHQVTPQGGQLSQLSLAQDQGQSVLRFDVERLGVTTLMAQYQLLIRDSAGQFKPLGEPVGVNIYPENPRLTYTAGLDPATLPAGSTLCVRLTHKDPGNPALADQTQCLP